MNILGIIPARSGSKGIPNKNIIEISGRPLISYTILPALRAVAAGKLSRLMVSTDSEMYADVSKSWGADVPFLRPSELSQDHSSSVDYVRHALDELAKRNDEHYDAVLILQPTSPLRTAADILKGIEQFSTSLEPSLISGYAEDYVNPSVMYRLDGDIGHPVQIDHNSGSGRQLHGRVFVRNGALYICRVEYLRRENRLISETPLFYKMPKWQSVNIDSEEDLELFRRLI